MAADMKTQRNFLGSGCYSKCRGGHFRAERLVRSPVVVEGCPISNNTARVRQDLESMPMLPLLLQDPNHAFDYPVLFGAVRCDEFLLQLVAAHQGGIAAAGADQAVIRSLQERRFLAA
jgi:hypothetical protein